MRLARPLAALALVLPALLPAAALAQDFQANTYTTDNQLRPDVAADEDGNFVVVWESEGDPPVAASSAVRGRRFDSSGAPLGSDFQISTVTGSHAGARVAMAPAGEFVVVWSYGDQCFLTPDACDIRARRFNASGAPLGSEFVVNSLTAGIQGYPDVARAPNGSFVIVWESQQSPDTDQSGGTILGRRFSASGTPMGPDFQLNSFTTSVQRRPLRRRVAEPGLARFRLGGLQRPGKALRLGRQPPGRRLPGQLLHHRLPGPAGGGAGPRRRLRRHLAELRLAGL